MHASPALELFPAGQSVHAPGVVVVLPAGQSVHPLTVAVVPPVEVFPAGHGTLGPPGQ